MQFLPDSGIISIHLATQIMRWSFTEFLPAMRACTPLPVPRFEAGSVSVSLCPDHIWGLNPFHWAPALHDYIAVRAKISS
jgi:hypothetical protein